ncbi:MAG: exopolysaccharide biosynthesis polyprenyl glycosylphosphotransferase [Pseudomonadota bacterium]|nr:exopolysaccharide biosynthesis polyprenyl glycosylphosphotransferase [Pseudomonadota bacterium]
MKAGCWIIPTIVLGRGKNARDVVRALQSEPRLGYRVIGVCDFSGVCEINAAEHPEDTTDPAKGEFVVIALDTSDIVQYEALAKGLSRRKVPFAFIPPIRGMSLIGLQTHYFFSHDVMLMLERNTLGQPFSHLAKRLFDIFFSSALILVLLPFVLVLALIIKRDGGPVFYRCTRVGYGGRHFDCLKFRSMVVDAKEKLEIHLKDNPAAAEEYGQFCKLRDDPRITAIGAFLRRTSLDEAPQLFNVLKGEMSLVGPRPAMPHELYRFGDLVDEYCEVKPGITGVWQVSGRNDVNFEDRVRFDTWYVVNWSFWHDIAILLKTIPVVFRRTGAY